MAKCCFGFVEVEYQKNNGYTLNGSFYSFPVRASTALASSFQVASSSL